MPDSYSQEASAQLVNLKTHGGLIHPNKTFQNMIMALESCFIKNCNLPDAYSRTVDDMLTSYKFSFPSSFSLSMDMIFCRTPYTIIYDFACANFLHSTAALIKRKVKRRENWLNSIRINKSCTFL